MNGSGEKLNGKLPGFLNERFQNGRMAKHKGGSRGRILLIGRRKGAIAAASRCGWEPSTIDVAPRGEQTPGAFGGSSRLAVDQALKLFPDEPPVGVVAVATGAAVAAAAIRSHFGLPGISPETALSCHDKLIMKKAIAEAGIPCSRWVETLPDTSPADLIAELGLPLLLKMPISSGSRGVWVCDSEREVRIRFRPGLLAESFVTGTEMSVETFRAAGITVFRNHTRYLKPRWANVLPADLNPADRKPVDGLSERVHEVLGIDSGMTHMEIFLGKNGPVFGEIAARPPGGYLMELIRRAYGFDPWEILLKLAVEETPIIPDSASLFAGVWLIHPGAGEVREVNGLERIRTMEGVVHASCNLHPGDIIGKRIGSGESKGRILVEGASHRICVASLEGAAKALRISMATRGGCE